MEDKWFKYYLKRKLMWWSTEVLESVLDYKNPPCVRMEYTCNYDADSSVSCDFSSAIETINNMQTKANPIYKSINVF